MKKIIFLEGVDGSGKTFKANQLLAIKDNPFLYFRSNYQIDSEFAGEKINLEESLKHDWRILYDFITQICKGNKTILVDRGFISSIVYGVIFRNNSDVLKLFWVYVRLFSEISEFWFFIREDYQNMNADEKRINDYYLEIIDILKGENIDIKIFVKTKEGKFKADGFLNLHEEISSKRLNYEYYNNKITTSIFTLGWPDVNKVIVSDLDGTIVHEGYPKLTGLIGLKVNIDYINSLPYNNLIIITGREKCIPTELELKQLGVNKQITIIGNDKNYGLSSRVLKEYCVSIIKNYVNFIYLDDRKDVVDHLFKGKYRKDKLFDGYIASIKKEKTCL